jgi:DNA-binding SARP family transcriptional activator
MVDNAPLRTNAATGEPLVPQKVRLALALLGPPQVWVNGQPAIELRGQKMLALLAYLALESGRPHRRDALAACFWPEQPEAQGMQNLRQALARLRRALDDQHANPPHLLVEPHVIHFNRSSDYWLDVEAFRALLAAAGRHPHRRLEVCPTCLAQLSHAVELYRGELLEHLHPDGSAALDEWLLLEREQLVIQACTALHALGDARLAQDDMRAAAGYARRLLRLDPWDETAQRRLLCALAQGEGRNAALRQYQAFRQALLQELGVEPENETLALAASIRTGALAHAPPCAPLGAVPEPATPLIGRQLELQQIGAHLAGRERRLLTILGPGGCGKTRLALEIAARQARLWSDGVWWISVAETPSAEALVDVLANALGLRTDGRAVEAKQLLDFLRTKELLLVLDGFEHLASGATLLADFVRWAPEVRLLVTSRARLGVREEWTAPLAGLKLPPEASLAVAEVDGFSSVQLFVHSARRVDPAFRLTPENAPHVARICRLVDGLPLGIELAAPWVRLYDCRQIADQIQGGLDFLHLPDASPSQHDSSLRDAFDHS